jgi:hypothetical protein
MAHPLSSLEPRGIHDPFSVYPEAPPEVPVVEGDDFLSTLLDIINPLQHIPIISNIYRELTGDEIGGAARMIGGALFGGPLGFASASANTIIEQATGDDLFGHAVALISGDDPGEFQAGEAPPADPQLAALPDDALPSASAAVPGEATAPAATASSAAPATATAFVPGGEASRPGAAETSSATQPRPVARAAPVSLAPPATATEGDTIVLSGPPAVASQAAPQLPQNLPQAAAVLANEAGGRSAPIAGASAGSAFAPDPRPAWLAAALSDAQALNDSIQAGGDAAGPTAQPWVTRAMFDALDKYETLVRSRRDTEDSGR